MKYLVTVFAALATVASAQNFSDIPTCAQAAAVTAFASTGCQITDIKCVCSNTAFISGVADAIKSTCSAADQAATVAFAQKFCASAGVTLPATTLGGSSSTASAAPQSSSVSEAVSSSISSVISSVASSVSESSAAATTSAEETSAAATTSAAETSAAVSTSAVTASATATYVPVPVPSVNGTISTGAPTPTPTFVSGAVANAGSILLSIAMAGVAVFAL